MRRTRTARSTRAPAEGRARRVRGPLVWPLLLVTVGVAWLLHNLLLLEGFDITRLWPLLLVLLGAQLLLRGDVWLSGEEQSFGITRGSVETALLEVHAGESDVKVRALSPEQRDRLIAGRTAAGLRPALDVRETHAHLRMERARTLWFSFADWQMGLARDLPWQIVIGSHLGQIQADLSELLIDTVSISTGIGDVRLTCPPECLQRVQIRSTLGHVIFETPPGYRAEIHTRGGPFFRVMADENRYAEAEPGLYHARDADERAQPVTIYLRGAFGDAYLV